MARLRPGGGSLVPLVSTLSLALVGGALSLLAARPGLTIAPSSPLTLAAEGSLGYDVRDSDTGNGIPCKLTLVSVGTTPRVGFTKNDIGRQEGDAILAFDRIMSATGQGAAHVPYGTYDIYVSRGPEWDLHISRRVVVGAKPQIVTARLHHVVDTAGWVSADFHVHAQMSTDSHVPMHDRIYEFLSDGVEIITSTDHNVVADYAPVIAELGVGMSIGSIAGDELTTGTWGHFGAFPLPQQLERAGHGAVLVHGKNAVDFFRDVRVNAPVAVIDVHHPRIDTEIGYFNLAHFDSTHDRSDRAGFSFDFDALEVLNGYQDPERRHIDGIIADWFALLNHGHVVTATGNSDTHHLDHNIGGYPRNYVKVLDDRPSVVRPEEVARAVKGHHSLFTTAPFVLLHVNGADIGSVTPVKGGKVGVEVEVRAAPWVSVSTVTLFESGKEVKRWKLPPPAPTVDVAPGGVRFKERLELPVSADGWIVARVDGDLPLAPVVGDRVRFDVRPLAVTNPVFLDYDGNGVYDAPLKAGQPPSADHTKRAPGAPP